MNAPVESSPSLKALGECLERVIEKTQISDTITFFEPIYELYSTETIEKQWDDVIESVKEKS